MNNFMFAVGMATFAAVVALAFAGVDVDILVGVAIAIFVVLAVAGFIWNTVAANKAYKMWQQFGVESGLEFQRKRRAQGRMNSGWSLRGRRDDWSVDVYTLHSTAGDQAQRKIYTCYDADLSGCLPAGVSVAPQTLVGKALVSMVGKDVKMGDAAFDAAFIVSESGPGTAKAFLGEQRRAALLALQDAFDWVVVEPASARASAPVLRIREHGRQGSAAAMDKALSALTRCASALRAGA